MGAPLAPPVAAALDESPADLDARALADAYRTGRLSPVAAAEAALARIARLDALIGAFVHVDPPTTLAMARASEARWRAGAPLSAIDGVPTSVKDLLAVAGWPLRRGSLAHEAHPPSAEDSAPVARLREAGAVFVGKTATPESGYRIVTRSRVHGVTRNPYALDRTPGGSSGGAAAALALGMGALAVGTDGAGSIRIPAAFCNVAGLKPGFGRVPAVPPSLFMPHAVTGPMARTIADVAAMAALMARPDPRDPYAWPVPFDEAATTGPVAGVRIALSPTLGTPGQADAATRAALARAADALEAAGAIVEEADPVWPVDPHEPFMVFWEATYAGFLDTYPPERQALMEPALQAIAARGRAIDGLAYHRAMGQRLAIASAARAFLNRYDAVLAPVMPSAAFDLEAEAPPGERRDDWRWCPYTYLFNMTGLPALAVPAGFTDDGRPVGVQIAGAAGTEERLLRLGAAIEAAIPACRRRPALVGAGAEAVR